MESLPSLLLLLISRSCSHQYAYMYPWKLAIGCEAITPRAKQAMKQKGLFLFVEPAGALSARWSTVIYFLSDDILQFIIALDLAVKPYRLLQAVQALPLRTVQIYNAALKLQAENINLERYGNSDHYSKAHQTIRNKIFYEVFHPFQRWQPSCLLNQVSQKPMLQFNRWVIAISSLFQSGQGLKISLSSDVLCRMLSVTATWLLVCVILTLPKSIRLVLWLHFSHQLALSSLYH